MSSRQTVDVAARLVGARYAALGVLDRTGSHLERLITTGIDDDDESSDRRPAQRPRRSPRPASRGAPGPRCRRDEGAAFLRLPARASADAELPRCPDLRAGRRVRGPLPRGEGGGEFTEEDEEIVTLLAAQTGDHDRKGADPRGGRPLDSSARGARRAHPQRPRGARRVPPPRARRPSPARADPRPAGAHLPSRPLGRSSRCRRGRRGCRRPGRLRRSSPNRSTLGSSRAGRASASTHFWRIPRSIRSLPAESAA